MQVRLHWTYHSLQNEGQLTKEIDLFYEQCSLLVASYPGLLTRWGEKAWVRGYIAYSCRMIHRSQSWAHIVC